MSGKFYVVLLAVVAVAVGAPANNAKDEVETIPTSNEGPFGPNVVVDTDAAGGFSNPFGGLLQGLEGLMSRIRQQFDQVLNRLPNGGNVSDINAFNPFGGLDLSKGNTTSVTKVVNGHKVTINETSFNQEDENGKAVVRVRVINVDPASDESGESAEPAKGSAVESMGESSEKEAAENEVKFETLETPEEQKPILSKKAQLDEELESFQEIPNSFEPQQEDRFENLETFDEIQPSPTPDLRNAYQIATNSIEDLDRIENDLSGDIYVNQLMADAGVTPNPDAEVFDPNEGPVPLQYEKYEIVDPRR